jgi:hypothetical protein
VSASRYRQHRARQKKIPTRRHPIQTALLVEIRAVHAGARRQASGRADDATERYLLERNFTVDTPNTVWAGGMTRIPTWRRLAVPGRGAGSVQP